MVRKWFVSGSTGEIYSKGEGTKTNMRIMKGSVITCIFDRARNCVSFEVDGELLRVAESDLSQVKVYAAASIQQLDIQLSIEE